MKEWVARLVTCAVGSTVIVAFFAAPLINDNIDIDGILNLQQSRASAVTFGQDWKADKEAVLDAAALDLQRDVKVGGPQGELGQRLPVSKDKPGPQGQSEVASLQGPKGGPGPEEQKDETRLQGPKGGPGPQDQKDEKRLQGPTGGPGPQDQKEVTGLQGPKDESRLQGPKGEPSALGSTLHILRGQPSNSFHWPRRTAPGHVYVPDAKIITID